MKTEKTGELLQAALTHHQAGRIGQAEQIYRSILAVEPDNADANHLLGLLAYQVGKYDIAVTLIQKAIQQDPGQSIFYNNLGNILKTQGKLHEAAAAFTRALVINPKYVEAHNNLGVVLREQGNLQEAIMSFQKALDIQPSYADALYNLGNAYYSTGDFYRAADAFKQTIVLVPDSADAYNNLGNAQRKIGNLEEAYSSFMAALSIQPDFYRAYNNLGVVLKAQGDYDAALSAFHRALEINKDFAEGYKNLADTYKELGNLDQAVESYKQALVLKPDFAEAHRKLAHTKKHHAYDEEVRAMETLLQDQDMSEDSKMHLYFGLGKAFEDLTQYDKAFNYIIAGNRLKRHAYFYDISKEYEFFKRIKSVFTEKFLSDLRNLGTDSNMPVFIVGMPRSGTTLIEQILSAHPHIYGAGELLYLQDMIRSFCSGNGDFAYPECVLDFSENDLAQLGCSYVEKLRQHSQDVKYITNKMPHNFLHIGFIKRILPRARIIHCKRNPMDTCLSIFKNEFAGTHNYAYDLKELGEYYMLYKKLMEHWLTILPGFIFEVQYEKIVNDLENEIQQLLTYLELDWEDSCLDFYRSSRSVKTASAIQVRQPIYHSSVGLWRRYEKQLAPLAEVLNYAE